MTTTNVKNNADEKAAALSRKLGLSIAFKCWSDISAPAIKTAKDAFGLTCALIHFALY